MVAKLHQVHPAFYNNFGAFRANMMGLVDRRTARSTFIMARLRARDADGEPIFDHVDYTAYHDVLQEEVKPWTYMKFPHIKALGPENGWYRVGPLARVQVCDFIPSQLAEIERKDLLALGDGKPVHGTLLFTGRG